MTIDMKAMAMLPDAEEETEKRRMRRDAAAKRMKAQQQEEAKEGGDIGKIIGGIAGGLIGAKLGNPMMGYQAGSALGGAVGAGIGGGEVTPDIVAQGLGGAMQMPGGGELMGMEGAKQGSSVSDVYSSRQNIKNLDKQLAAGLISKEKYDQLKMLMGM